MDPEDYETDNHPDIDLRQNGETKADFTGRELLISSLREKCYHYEVKKLIERGGSDIYNLEKLFIDEVISRLSLCED